MSEQDLHTTTRKTAIAAEIASQPECWGRALALDPRISGELPPPGARLAVIGCGTSLFMAQAFAALREASGNGETDAFPASEFPSGRRYEWLLALTRSGTTTEVLDTLSSLHPSTRTVAITASAATPIVDAVHNAVVLSFADERSIVQTRFATSTLLLLRHHLGEDVAPVVDDCVEALEAPLPELSEERRQFTFLGAGWTIGVANEAALKLREASCAWAEAYPAMEYRHGPIAVTSARSLVWFLGPAPHGLVEEVVRAGAGVELSALDPLADLVRIQRLAVRLAVTRGLDPDNPQNLSRSVVLASA